MHSENENDQANRFRTAQLLKGKLLIIIVCDVSHLEFEEKSKYEYLSKMQLHQMMSH